MIGILAFIAGALLSYVVFDVIASHGTQQPTVVAQNPALIAPQTGNTPVAPASGAVAVITQSSDNPDENVFSASSLGISFNYSKYVYSFDENNPGLNRSLSTNDPKLNGNTISFGPTYSSSMTVYKKDIGQSLESAIQSQFLQNIPSTQCQTIRVQAGSDYQFYNPSSNISYVVLHSVTPNGCPTQFDTTNPTATFFSFASQPNVFFYIIGESNNTMPLTTATGDPFWTTMKFTQQ